MIISEALNQNGYSDISTVYAYYTAEEKAVHGKHCEYWTEFGSKYPPYVRNHEQEFIAFIEAQAPGKFQSYLISWSGCD
jgi:hypothetical protein